MTKAEAKDKSTNKRPEKELKEILTLIIDKCYADFREKNMWGTLGPVHLHADAVGSHSHRPELIPHVAHKIILGVE